MTTAQNLAMLGSAAQLTAIDLNLDMIPAGDWDQDSRVAYVHALAQRILATPNSFLPSTVASASAILGSNLSGMSLGNYVTESPDGSAAIQKIFVDELGDHVLAAGGAFSDLGNGVLNVISRSGAILSNLGTAGENASKAAGYGWVMPAAVIAVLGLVVVQASRETRAVFGR